MNHSWADDTVVEDAIRKDREAAWEEINALIKQGDLPGNGCDESAVRNGLILAANLLMRRIHEEQ